MVQPSEDRRKHLLALLASWRTSTPGAHESATCQHLLRGNHIELAYYLPNLRGWRLAFGLSMDALYLASGVETKTIRALERGARAARLGTIHRLADALTLSNLHLVTQEPPEPDSLTYRAPMRVQAEADAEGVLHFALAHLRITRYLAGFSRHALAAATGINTHRLRDLETYQACARVAEIAMLARALDIEPQRLISQW